MNMKAKYPKIGQEQKAFEKWYAANHFANLRDLRAERKETGGYNSDYINGAWRGWQGHSSQRSE